MGARSVLSDHIDSVQASILRPDPFKVDLHTHSTASDGTLTPSELVTRAHTNGVGVLAIADHDSVEGVAEGLTSAKG